MVKAYFEIGEIKNISLEKWQASCKISSNRQSQQFIRIIVSRSDCSTIIKINNKFCKLDFFIVLNVKVTHNVEILNVLFTRSWQKQLRVVYYERVI